MNFDVQMSPAEEVSASDAHYQRTGRRLFGVALLAFLPAFFLLLITAPLVSNQQWRVSAFQSAGYVSREILMVWDLLKHATVVASVILMLLGAVLFLAPSRSVGQVVAVGLGLCFMTSSSMPVVNGLLFGTEVAMSVAHGLWCLSLMMASGAFLLPLLTERYRGN